MNKAFLLGRLTKDPDVRYTATSKVVCQFTLAIERPFTNQDGQHETDFINVVLWGKSAEQFGNNVKKGQRVLVEGRIQVRSYEAKDGTKRYATEVIADRFEYVEKRSDSPANFPFSSTQSDSNTFSPAPQSKPSCYDSMGELFNPDKEIPF